MTTNQATSQEKTDKPAAEHSHQKAPIRPATLLSQSGYGIGNLQSAAGNFAVQQLLQPAPIQSRQDTSPLGDQYARPRLSQSGLAIQRVSANESTPSASTTGAPTATTPPPTLNPAPPALIVDDAVIELAPGQLRKSAFMAQLREAVNRTAESTLAGTIWSAVGCPYISRWFEYYDNRDSQQIERAIRRYAPETAQARAASDYIPLICAQVRAGMEAWLRSGDIMEAPDRAPVIPSGGGEEGPLSGLVRGAENILSSIGGLFFKRRETGAAMFADPRSVQTELQAGRALDSGVRSHVERLYGTDLAGVRVHTDATAARLSKALNARAFTVGKDIAFGQGEYRPGTLMGDALMAHELAHVAQQRDGSANAIATQSTGHAEDLFEREADRAAVHVVASQWGIKAEEVRPRLHSGLRLQRCKSERQREIERLAGLQRSFLEERARRQERERRERERQRQIEQLRSRGVANPESQVPPVQRDIDVTPEDIANEINRTVRANTPPPNPIQRWLNVPDKAAYLREARAVLRRVATTAQGDPQFADISRLLQQAPLVITEETAKTGLRDGWYAWVTAGSGVMVSMDFIDDARRDPRNVFPVIAHEIGGHPVFIEYLQEISQAVLSGLSPALRSTLVGTGEARQDYFNTYEYQATEIYSAVRQRRYTRGVAGFTPTCGAIDPDTNIPLRLGQMQRNWHRDVVKAVLKDLLQQLAANPNVRRDDINFLRSQIRTIMGYDLP